MKLSADWSRLRKAASCSQAAVSARLPPQARPKVDGVGDLDLGGAGRGVVGDVVVQAGLALDDPDVLEGRRQRAPRPWAP